MSFSFQSSLGPLQANLILAVIKHEQKALLIHFNASQRYRNDSSALTIIKIEHWLSVTLQACEPVGVGSDAG